MLDPRELLENGIEVYRADQRPGEYVCTFFKVYCGLYRPIMQGFLMVLMWEKLLTLCLPEALST